MFPFVIHLFFGWFHCIYNTVFLDMLENRCNRIWSLLIFHLPTLNIPSNSFVHIIKPRFAFYSDSSHNIYYGQSYFTPQVCRYASLE